MPIRSPGAGRDGVGAVALHHPTPGTFGFVGLDLAPAAIPGCSCVAGHPFGLLLFGSEYELDVPANVMLCGTDAFVQGLEFGAGTCWLPIELTRAVRASIR